jgi:hypothetical protein
MHLKEKSSFAPIFRCISHKIIRGINSNLYTLQPFLQYYTHAPTRYISPSSTSAPVTPITNLDYSPLVSCLPSSLLSPSASAKDFHTVVSSVTEDNRYNEKYRRIED